MYPLPDSSLFPVLFHNDIPDRFFTPFENDGRYSILFCNKPFSVSAHTYILFFRICSHLPLSSTCQLTLSPTIGDSLKTCILYLLPDKRRQLTVCILLFYGNNQVILFKIMNSFFLSCKLPPNTEGSAEPCEAIGASWRTQVRICNTCNLCPDSSLRSRMMGRQVIPFCKKLLFTFLLTFTPFVS